MNNPDTTGVHENKKTRIVIVGAGFGGIRAALELSRIANALCEVTLVSPKPNFEYNPALYRFVTGNSALEVCIPLSVIFKGKPVLVVQDKITQVDQGEKSITGESGKTYSYDKLILALGSETTYMGIEGLKENSFGMKTISEALRLREHINKTLHALKEHNDTAKNIQDVNFVVVGGGATGVELAGRLVGYSRTIAKNIGLNPALISISLIEYAPKVLFRLSDPFTLRIEKYLRRIGVTLLMNTQVMKQDVEEIYLNDAQLKTNTVIWTAGVQANELYSKAGFAVTKQGKAEVDEHLHAKGSNDIFVIGDGAQTIYSGWAQTAFYDGCYVARVIVSELKGKNLPRYDAPKPINAIPAGDKWAAVSMEVFGREIRFYGRIGWWFRRFADLRSFMVILPFKEAYKIWVGGCISEICDVCGVTAEHTHE